MPSGQQLGSPQSGAQNTHSINHRRQHKMAGNQDTQSKKRNNLVAFFAGSAQSLRLMITPSQPTTSHGNSVVAATLALLGILCVRADASTLIQITPDNPSTTGIGFVVLSSGWNVLNPLYDGPPGNPSGPGLADYGVADLLDSNGGSTGISLAADDTNRFNAYN